ncbi:MAG: hypothetical protein A2W19_15505 [Spirochaetes bacterium RBG_16_49_21]|nr:MAG: hypothetical protein A2W19_15505 [Spirochaetes bacterium RBG_16_49_21]
MKRIVQDQKITDVKVRLARDFRKGMTEAERAFWCLVRNRKLCNLKFRRQQIIDGFIVDFFCNEAGLVIEIDGPIHKEKEQMVIDKERGEIFKRRGLKELRFSNGEVLNDPEAVRETIKQVVSTPPSLIEERGAGG